MGYKTGRWGIQAKERSKKRTAYFVAYHSKRKLRKYGMTEDDYQRMFKKQKGVCAICKKQEYTRVASFVKGNKNIQRLSVDHDHKTGKVRGLLCFSCNRALGYFKDSKEMLKDAIVYLDSPPA